MGIQGRRLTAQVATLLAATCVSLHGGETRKKSAAPQGRIPLKAFVVGPRTTELEAVFEKGSLEDHDVLVRWTMDIPVFSVRETTFEINKGVKVHVNGKLTNKWVCKMGWAARSPFSATVHTRAGESLFKHAETAAVTDDSSLTGATKAEAEKQLRSLVPVRLAPAKLCAVATLVLAEKLRACPRLRQSFRGAFPGPALRHGQDRQPWSFAVRVRMGGTAQAVRVGTEGEAHATKDLGEQYASPYDAMLDLGGIVVRHWPTQRQTEALTEALQQTFWAIHINTLPLKDAREKSWDEVSITARSCSVSLAEHVTPETLVNHAEMDVAVGAFEKTFHARLLNVGLGSKTGKRSATIARGVVGLAKGLVSLASLGSTSVFEARLAAKRSVRALAEDLFVQIWTDPDFQAFIRDVDEKKTEPAALSLEVAFDDTQGLLPNNSIDAGETCALRVRATNTGEGTAFGVRLKVASSSDGVSAQEDTLLGDIAPQGSEQATVELVATTSLATGTTELLITADDRRGFSATPIRLEVLTAAMTRPALSLESCALSDGAGLADGDGDGTPENGETLELTPCIANNGPGEALQVNVSLCEVTPGIEVIHGRRVLSAVAPGKTGKATLSLRIPRIFTGTELSYTVVAEDVRGIKTRKAFTTPFVPQEPALQLSCRILDRQGKAAIGLTNDRAFRFTLTLRNTGGIPARGVRLKVGCVSDHVTMGHYEGAVGSLVPGAPPLEIAIPVSLARTFPDEMLRFTVTAAQEDFNSAVQNFSFPVRCLRPQLDARITLQGSHGEPTFVQNTRPTLRLSVANRGEIDAAEVTVHMKLTHAGIALDREETLGTIRAGQECYKDFSFFVRSDAVPGPAAATVVITQEDFPQKELSFPCRIDRQKAIVQRVAGATIQAVATSVTHDVPPEIYIVFPDKGATIYTATAAIRGTLITFGEGNVPEKLTVTLNGRAVSVQRALSKSGGQPAVSQVHAWPAGDGKTTFEGMLAFDLGRNEIRIAVVDRNGRHCESRVQVERQQRLGEIRAVVVGIDSFPKAPDYQLMYAESDAQRFWEFLGTPAGGGLPLAQRRLLTGTQTTRAAVIAVLTEFLGRAGKEDTAILYLATHGLVDETDGALYLACHDTDPKNLLGTGLSDRDLTHILTRRIVAAKVVVYLDACHSALSGLSTRYAKRGMMVREANTGISRLASELSARKEGGVHTFTAVSAEGLSGEDEKWGGGLFTYCLLLGLDGKANRDSNAWVDVGELDRYLSTEVHRRSKGKQAPKAYGTLPLDTPLSNVR